MKSFSLLVDTVDREEETTETEWEWVSEWLSERKMLNKTQSLSLMPPTFVKTLSYFTHTGNAARQCVNVKVERKN